MAIISKQKGASIIVVIAIMLILAVMGSALISLVRTGTDISINELGAEQAYSIAEGGKEYILANRNFPNYSQVTPITLGTGSFTVSTPTYLTAAVTISATTITVASTSSFPSSGKIRIDAEVLTYTGTTATTFTGVFPATNIHTNGNAVYPVTTLTGSDLTAVATTINVTSTTGFLIPGIIKSQDEYIYCTTATATAFSGCIRGYHGSTARSHTTNNNVYQYVITSTGTVSAANSYGYASRSVTAMVDGAVGVTKGCRLTLVETY